MENILFKPLKVGALELQNRIVMAPLTRQRAGKSRTPNDLMLEYYIQRASAGLIITEATSITPMGVGYEDSPGIWNNEQTEGWKKITSAVHQKGGKIFLQLWHVGRISHSSFLHGELPVAPSAVRPAGHVSQVRPTVDYETPRALETREVKNLVLRYKEAAERAKVAGFDGVEIHAANGYLIDQFIQSKTNKREDEYGGNIENRARFLLEITDAIIDVWGADRVGVHLAPACDAHDVGDDTPLETFSYIAQELGKRKIAFIFTREGQSENSITPTIKKEFGGVVIANQGLDVTTAEKLINDGKADAVAWGKYFISNPNLVEKIKEGKPLTEADPETFYSKGSKGYTDYV
ncbi:MAG: alkene reductase [Bdellovibrio sp. CG11_big_fil_rev_8_21_14_0_20_39_38]|nr:MAG: alkene reductase [Bdellovibrio sp. CG22_combo_CG10-13_8_21_14_all_39_27]PIR35096.1 MAG: alkene reductase [Bdellovibrio sp. CG11_big_fil_rev_8_21_14_0_20_39_38]